MPIEPRFSYFLSQRNTSVLNDSKIWKTLLPLKRNPSGKDSQRITDTSISYGDYFSAVRSFLEKNRFNLLLSAIDHHINRKVNQEDIEEIQTYLVKHGEFYHPARIVTIIDGSSLSFVLNVAVSATGQDCIKREYKLLQRLNKDFPFSFLPEVYGQGKVYAKENLEINMLLGEWFVGFNEFHISYDKTDGRKKIIVWDSRKDNFFLSQTRSIELYRQSAMILSCFYNPETFEQISPWHHASGDFVLRLRSNKLDVKLITVRQYSSMFKNTNGIENGVRDAELILEAMLVFLLNLSIRMRLDRIDGVGPIVWSDDIAVKATLEGFFEALTLKHPISLLSDTIAPCFRKHLLSCSESDVFDLSKGIVDAYNPLAPEVPIIKQNLETHVEVLYNAMQNL